VPERPLHADDGIDTLASVHGDRKEQIKPAGGTWTALSRDETIANNGTLLNGDRTISFH